MQIFLNDIKTVVWEGGGNLGKQTQFEIAHFADCIKNGKTPITDGPAALQSLCVIRKMYDTEKPGTVADLRGLGLPKNEN